MLDREKVIKDLEDIKECAGYMTIRGRKTKEVAAEAIELIKEYEGLEPLRKILSDEIHETAKMFRKNKE